MTLLSTTSLLSQNLESIGKEKPLKVSGGINTSQIFYAVNGIERRRDPYSYFLTGSLNFDLYGWSVPLSFSLSNQNSSFQQPFNQIGLHPTYKWATAHLGWTVMTFSPYTLSGHLFRGAGVDLAPNDKIKVSAMYGRLQKAVALDTVNGNQPFYRRTGFGFKAGYGSGTNQINFILFRAKDDENSLASNPEEAGVFPEENLVLSVGGSKSFLKNWVISAEWATSAITRDTRTAASEDSAVPPFGSVGRLYTPRIASSYYQAFKSGVAYKAQAYSFGVGYERIDPGYRTLGAYFFNNDLENITINGTAALLKGKLNLGANVGSQRDNLDNTKTSTLRRLVGSLNLGYAASQNLNFAASYSNFQTFANIRPQFEQVNQLTPFDNLDTLDFTQIAQNANLNVAYIFKANKAKRQSINANITFQDAADEQGGVKQNTGNRFYNLNTAYGLSLIPTQTNVTIAFNYAKNESGTFNTTIYGPTAALSRAFFDKKLRTTLSASWNNTVNDGETANQTFNIRVNGGYTLKKKHNLTLSLISVSRNNQQEQGSNSFTEFTGTLGYGYNF